MWYASIWGIYNSVKLLTALSITASKTAGAALTSLSLTMLQRLNREFPRSHQAGHRCPHWERTPTQLIPLSAAFHPVLNLTGFTCLLAYELFKQADHVLPQKAEVTSLLVITQYACNIRINSPSWFTLLLSAATMWLCMAYRVLLPGLWVKLYYSIIISMHLFQNNCN